MVDLPDDSVIIGGLEDWRYRSEDIHALTIHDEPRLLAKVRDALKESSLTLRMPPAQSDAPTRQFSPDVTAWRFPLWFTLTTVWTAGNHRRRRLVKHADTKNGRFEDERGTKHDVVPVRFVSACEAGHVDDIDWHRYVHHGNRDCTRAMYLEERGTSGDVGDIFVVCECTAQEPLYRAAFRELQMLGTCSGRRPWLGTRATEPCGRPARLLVRNASNAYFPQVLSAISIPPRGKELDEFVGSHIDALKDVLETTSVLKTLRKMQPFTDGLRSTSDEEVIESIHRVLAQGVDTVNIKDAEFDALSTAKDEVGVDKPHGVFFARKLPEPQWRQPWLTGIRRVVLVHRLREVIALIGFTRFEAASKDLNGELDLDVARAAIARDLSLVKWVPAIENRGEGVFIEFDPALVHSWCKRAEVASRGEILREGFDVWAAEHQGTKLQFVGAPFVLLHSISHLLLTSLSLECGYPSSALRERIYALPPTGKITGRYGILIYTGSSDAEGTLGGLIEAGRSIERHLRQALEYARLCSNDPVCSAHRPAQHGHAPLLGAACHGCMLISETSCEMRNDFLDRALVVPTVEPHGCEFFPKLP